MTVDAYWPTVGGQDGGVEALVSLGEPRWAGVVQVCQRAFDKVGLREPRRVEPTGAEAVEIASGFGDGVALGIGWVRERERLEGRVGRVARPRL